MLFINMLINSIITTVSGAWQNRTASTWESITTNWESLT